MEHQSEYMRQGGMPSDMSMDQHMRMMERRRLSTLWCHLTNIGLGFWLLSAPFVLGYHTIAPDDLDLARLAAERSVPAVETRAALMTASDILSGLLIIVFSVLSLRRVSWAQWAVAVVGTWLLFAPIAFWTPSPGSYNNALLVGGLVIAFSVLVPMMPGMSMEGMMQKATIPPGWDYNPSTWIQRLPIVIMAILGILLARYLAGYQLGHIQSAWDPFFSPAAGRNATELNGTERIITSDMSRAWPVSDAGIGVMAYMLELLMGVMGDGRRWRTMPWMVAGFGIVVVPLGAVSIFFIMAQPVVIGTWCSLCLIQALAMLVMMPYALDELVAMGQFLKDARRRGKPFWRSFFMGEAMPGSHEDPSAEFGGGLRKMSRRATAGVNLPIGLLLVSLLGVWLMFSRLIFGTEGAMANSDHLTGGFIITISVLAMAEVARPLRLLNIPFGLWLLVAPWLLDGASGIAAAASMVSGLLVIALSLPKGAVRHSYGEWNDLIF